MFSIFCMQRSCTQCGQTFDLPETDLALLDRLAPVFAEKKELIPPPTLCPDCRWQRRLCFRNERKLYHRKCDLSGRSMISMHPTGTSFPVYYITEWLSDKWNPQDSGRPFDFSRPFFEQFQELCNIVPHFNLFIDPHLDQNSEYTNCSSEAKNCYMITQAEKNEDCYYSRGINRCKDCCDCLRISGSELCYECINVTDSYKCTYLQDCDNCNDCHFGSDLRGCKNCFGCHGLAQKQYCLFNEQLSKDEWEAKVGSLTLTHEIIKDMQAKSMAARLKTPQRASHLLQCENSTGDHLTECRDAHNCFDSRNLETCAYCYELLNGAKDSMDFSMFGLNCELDYECNGCGYNVYRTLFSNHCWQNVTDLLYCESCFPSVKNCFGCFGLRQAEYCILNKQYTKEEYEALVPKIIDHMRATKEWGEFFPQNISAYAYNESLAGEFFPLTKEEVLQRGWKWHEEETEQDQYLGPRVDVPASITETSDEICKQILTCSLTDKPYKIIPQELSFYRQMGLPIPTVSPQARHLNRMAQRNPRHLRKRQCDECGTEVDTTITPERTERVLCDGCYLRSI